MAGVTNIAELIDRLGGPTAFAKAIKIRPGTASEMKRAGAIHSRHWDHVIKAAARAGINLTIERLMRMQARRAS
jgi:hypothetical protein